MRKRTALMLAVVTALAVVGTALATMGSVTVTTFVRATLDANKPHDRIKASADHVKLHTKGATDVAMQTIFSPPGGVRVGTAIPASCWWRFSRAR
jgi:hypothetical protein